MSENLAQMLVIPEILVAICLEDKAVSVYSGGPPPYTFGYKHQHILEDPGLAGID